MRIQYEISNVPVAKIMVFIIVYAAFIGLSTWELFSKGNISEYTLYELLFVGLFSFVVIPFFLREKLTLYEDRFEYHKFTLRVSALYKDIDFMSMEMLPEDKSGSNKRNPFLLRLL